tara:strand:+ start:297 stop:650 length:354 start_codon:yes stop_codon:yes gene_type:complete
MVNNRLEEVRQQVKAYHKQYPEVWELFVQFTFDMIDKGFKNYAVSGIFERIRWEKDMGGDGLTVFKINNNYKPFYARAFMKKYPEHDGFFRTRKQTLEDKEPTNKPEISPMDIGSRL